MTEDASGVTSNERHTMFQFQQFNPQGPGQGNVPALLRRVADSIDELGDVEVYGLVMNPPLLLPDDEDWPSLAVYYDDKAADEHEESGSSQ